MRSGVSIVGPSDKEEAQMSVPSGPTLPPHVAQYLKDCNVKESDLPPSVRELLADLSVGEVAFLSYFGARLDEAGLDRETIACMH